MSQLMEQVCSIETLQVAADWLQSECPQYQPDLAKLARKLMSGDYCFQSVTTLETTNKLGESETLEVWQSPDRLVLKAMSLVLKDHLSASFPTCCHHLEGRGGIKTTVRKAREFVRNNPDSWVMKTNVKGYYAHIDHTVLYNQMQALIPNEDYLLRLIWQYLQRTVYNGGNYYDRELGISLGCPLSPLMAALYLMPLDEAFAGQEWFYARFMDDWVIVTPTRWKLNSAVEKVNTILSQRKLTQANDKTFIGRSKSGFNFLGYFFTPESLTVDKIARQRRDARISRLYEQGTDEYRVGEPVSRWQQWVTAGLQGQLMEEFQSVPRQADSSKLPLEAKFLALGVASVLSTAAFDSQATVYQLGTGFPSDGRWDLPCLNISFALEAKSPQAKFQTDRVPTTYGYIATINLNSNVPWFRVYNHLEGKVNEKDLVDNILERSQIIWGSDKVTQLAALSKFNQQNSDLVSGLFAKDIHRNLTVPLYGWVRVNYALDGWNGQLILSDNYGVVSYGVATVEIPSPEQIDNATRKQFCSDSNNTSIRTDTTITLLEDSTIHLWTGFNDAESDSFDSIKITQLETAGDLMLNGAEVTLNQIISATDINALTFTPTEDEHGTNYANFKFKVNDGIDEYTFTFHVLPVNDAPSFTKGANQVIKVGTKTKQNIIGWATNISKGATNESAQSLKFEVVPWWHTNIFSTKPAVDTNSTYIFSTKPAVDTNGTLTYTLSGRPGAATVSVKLQDDGGTTYNNEVDESEIQNFNIFVINVEKCNIVTEISQIECESLLQLYHNSTGESNTPCSWNGITCKNNSVTAIYLKDDQLRGPIPDLSGLPNLTTFRLNNNHLTGPIPDFSGLPNLRSLKFVNNYQLTGPIPDFSGLPNLEELWLSHNELTGPIPDFSGLPNLEELWLNHNKLTGPIPDFSGLPNLRSLKLSGNQLTGPIPDFSGLPHLERLDIYNNQLTRPIPDFSGLPNLNKLWLSGNQLTGPIPDFSLPNLENLELKKNQLTGPIPDFSGLPNLELLYLEDNQLTGPIPDFSGLPNLEFLYLEDNQLTGPIPDFSGLPNLKRLFLRENQLTGPIPDFSGLPNLEWLYLNNQLIGPIPDFSGLPNLYMTKLELATVHIILKKESYRPGEHFKAELKETFSNSYDLYVAVVLPNGTDFMALENINQFAPLNQPQKWLASRVENEEPITLLDLTLPADLATGKYCLYGIWYPKDELVLEKVEQWVMDRQCFKILPN